MLRGFLEVASDGSNNCESSDMKSILAELLFRASLQYRG